jgi:uncharacterized protein
MTKLFDLKPLVIAVLHLPSFGMADTLRTMAQLEDYALKNMSVFVDGGMQAVYLQDHTPGQSKAKEETIAIMSMLGSMVKREFTQIHLGIGLEANDPTSLLAIAHACGASFVRIKVFVGAMLKAEGIQQACGIEAVSYRRALGREDIQILADVHNPIGFPLLNIPIEAASEWAARAGANGIVLTGSRHDESLEFLKCVRQLGLKRPLLLGGGANQDNIAEVLTYADGVIVSGSLKKKEVDPGEVVLWDHDQIVSFMDAARSGYQE